MEPDVKVGDVLWFYVSATRGIRWRCSEIVGETRESWLLRSEVKVNKKTLMTRSRQYSERVYTTAQRENKQWYDANCRRIFEAMYKANVLQMKQIALILGVECETDG